MIKEEVLKWMTDYQSTPEKKVSEKFIEDQYALCPEIWNGLFKLEKRRNRNKKIMKFSLLALAIFISIHMLFLIMKGLWI